MLIQFPALFDITVQGLVLALNTVLLISVLIAVELGYAERPPESRRHLRDFYPIIAVVAGLLVLAVYRQIGAS
jgi:hypothetical protein